MRRDSYIIKTIYQHTVTFTYAMPIQTEKKASLELAQSIIGIYGSGTAAAITAKAESAVRGYIGKYNADNGTQYRFISLDSIKTEKRTYRFTARQIAERMEDTEIDRCVICENLLERKGGEEID